MPRILDKAARLIRREILRDPFLLTVKNWFKIDGDNSLRLNYPLSTESIVWDLGGYHGDFAENIYRRYGCKVFIFEPLPVYHKRCVDRFSSIEKVRCLNFGLSDKDGFFEIKDDGDASSFFRSTGFGHRAEIRSVTAMFDEMSLDHVDLLKINIEGGEYEVLPALIESGLINKVRYVQVQFHNFVSEATEKREMIRASLNRTHSEMWSYPFVWESWALKNLPAAPLSDGHS